jgi:hypothetical protein
MAGRKAIGERAMTAAERQQRRRSKIKSAMPEHGSEGAFRLELYHWMREKTWGIGGYSNLELGQIWRAFEDLSITLKLMSLNEARLENYLDWDIPETPSP